MRFYTKRHKHTCGIDLCAREGIAFAIKRSREATGWLRVTVAQCPSEKPKRGESMA